MVQRKDGIQFSFTKKNSLESSDIESRVFEKP